MNLHFHFKALYYFEVSDAQFAVFHIVITSLCLFDDHDWIFYSVVCVK